jgi:hypothetical protein
LLALESINEKPLTAIPNGKLIGVADNVNVSRRRIGNAIEPGTVVDLIDNLQTRALRASSSLRTLKSLSAIGTRRAHISLRTLHSRGALSALRPGQPLRTGNTLLSLWALLTLRTCLPLRALFTAQALYVDPNRAIPNGQLLGVTDNIDITVCRVRDIGQIIPVRYFALNFETCTLRTSWTRQTGSPLGSLRTNRSLRPLRACGAKRPQNTTTAHLITAQRQDFIGVALEVSQIHLALQHGAAVCWRGNRDVVAERSGDEH